MRVFIVPPSIHSHFRWQSYECRNGFKFVWQLSLLCFYQRWNIGGWCESLRIPPSGNISECNMTLAGFFLDSGRRFLTANMVRTHKRSFDEITSDMNMMNRVDENVTYRAPLKVIVMRFVQPSLLAAPLGAYQRYADVVIGPRPALSSRGHAHHICVRHCYRVGWKSSQKVPEIWCEQRRENCTTFMLSSPALPNSFRATHFQTLFLFFFKPCFVPRGWTPNKNVTSI